MTRRQKKSRKENIRSPRFPRILIITEGEKTEVAYFQSIYSKSQSLSYSDLEEYVELAIVRANRVNGRYTSSINYSERNPSTKVVELVSMLKQYL